ncbi:hypothetical protein EVJ50_02505 [Synechococcus sp. RSCCF101]|nr:hypothetical protein EVJ50_02505 [Synechococcus sp. RSCCF101]
MRLLAAEDLHATVAFLGACGEARALAAWRALAEQRHPPIEATAAGWRAMGSPERPSAYALVPGMGRGTLERLIGRWREPALEAAGLPRDRRPPLAHITLTRPPRRRAAALKPAMDRWLRTAPVPDHPVRFEELALYTWAEERSRRLFRIVERRPFSAVGSA